MAYDVEIKIFGKVSDPEAMFEFANAAAAEGKIGWMGDVSQENVLGLLELAESEGRALTLTHRATTDLFDMTRDACQEAGLSYLMTYGDTGGDTFSKGMAWRPGMTDEYEFLVDGKGVAFKASEVRRAAAKGIDAVNAMLERAATLTLVGKVEIEPGFKEAFVEHSGWGAPAPAR